MSSAWICSQGTTWMAVSAPIAEASGMSASDMPDASALGADTAIQVVPWEQIHAELKGADHLLFF